MVTEIGAGAFYGFRSPEHDKWTEGYQAETLEKQLNEVLAYEDCMGFISGSFATSESAESGLQSGQDKGIIRGSWMNSEGASGKSPTHWTFGSKE